MLLRRFAAYIKLKQQSMKPIFSTESELEFHAAWNRLTEAGIPVTLSTFNERALNWLIGGGAFGLVIFAAYHVFK